MRKLNFIRTLLLALCVPLALASMPTPASAQIAVGISVHVGTSSNSGLRAASMPHRRLSLDSRLLGLR